MQNTSLGVGRRGGDKSTSPSDFLKESKGGRKEEFAPNVNYIN
jgi:hypothetical protein